MGAHAVKGLLALACAVALAVALAPLAASSPTAASREQKAMTALEIDLLQQLNAIRAAHGLASLRPSDALAAAADQHSRERGDDGYFDHNSADGTSFSSRIAHFYPAVGRSEWSVGENLLWYSPTVGAGSVASLWMHSPEHRANILDPRWREIGIGAVHLPSAAGAYRHLQVTIVTADFGVRR
jgi:uncharacterized protein YkwD